ncbi:MAG: hypothetical protein H6661_03155 [Ardenticatenaceae bacterium]|nr:hypothetical protein [Ardenticatenaceae bacterium]
MPQSQNQNFRIYEYMTRTTWLHAQDALHFTKENGEPIPKLQLFAGLYRQGEGANSQISHWLDAADARVLFADLSWGKAVDFIDYKGSNGQQPISRVLRVNAKDDKVYFQLTEGPGKATTTGAITPAGPVETKINVGMTKNDARKMAYAILEHMQAYATALAVIRNMPAPRREPSAQAKEIAGDEDLVEELFGYSDRPQRATGESFRGRAVTTTAPAELPSPTKRNGAPLYRTGDPVAEADVSAYNEYRAANGYRVPQNREQLMGWFYK